MIIRTYDEKDEAKYDLKGLEEYFQSHLDLEEQKKRETIAKAESYYQGYRDAMYAIKGILEASNYRVEEE